LVVFRTKVKDQQNREHMIDAVSYMPMVAGIRKRLRNSGEVVSATAEVVYKNDRFRYRLGTDPVIEHEPAGLDEEPGVPIGAYAVITLKSGEKIIDVARRKEIEAARMQGRAPNSLMWTKFWGEGARKTILRRAAKAAPQAAAMLQSLLQRDEELPDLPPAEDLPLVPQRPRREDFVASEQKPPESDVADQIDDAASPSFVLIDNDGEELEFPTATEAGAKLWRIYEEAATLGRDRLDAAGENNESALGLMRNTGHADIADGLDNYLRALQSRYPQQAGEAAE
jgi:hypothetical protein